MIPVAMGGMSRKDYEKIAPSHSFIHVDDFSSPDDLMKFLHKLSKDAKEYNSYYWWKSYYDIGVQTCCPEDYITTQIPKGRSSKVAIATFSSSREWASGKLVEYESLRVLNGRVESGWVGSKMVECELNMRVYSTKYQYFQCQIPCDYWNSRVGSVRVD